MNNLTSIYQEFGPDFCLCPFLGAFYQTNQVTDNSTAVNTIVPCSLTQHSANEFSVVNNSILESINQPIWRQIRQQFVQGQFNTIPSCATCHRTESQGGHSARLGANQHFVQHSTSDIVALVRQIVANGYVTDRLLSIDWFPSNYCNLKCIMCAGGASSARMTWEIQTNGITKQVVINTPDQDFYSLLKDIEIINFTGGETLMQPQVHQMIEYLVDNNLAQNKTIFMLTNATTYPDKLMSLFEHFKQVIYMCSLDGVGSVLEYQRRGARWSDVGANSLKLFRHPRIATVGNLVLTAVNAPGIRDFVQWVQEHGIYNGIAVSPVFRAEYLDVSVMPDVLRIQTIAELEQMTFDHGAVGDNCRNIVSSVLAILNNATHNPLAYQEFCQRIKLEDQDSAITLAQAVPEWAPYIN